MISFVFAKWNKIAHSRSSEDLVLGNICYAEVLRTQPRLFTIGYHKIRKTNRRIRLRIRWYTRGYISKEVYV